MPRTPHVPPPDGARWTVRPRAGWAVRPRARRAHATRAAVLALACGTLSGCNLLSPDRATSLSSSPPGASVIINGRDSGFATPCYLDLGADDPMRIEFELPGFVTETRLLTPDKEAYAMLWREGNVGPGTWRIPLFLNLLDFIVPVKWANVQSPGRVHVELRREADLPSTRP
jgi:hypothetical protein